jgi:hypothetical protein
MRTVTLMPREDEGPFSEHRQSPGIKKSSASAYPKMRVPANTWPALLSAHAAHTPACPHSLPLFRRDKQKKEKKTQQSNLNGGSFFSHSFLSKLAPSKCSTVHHKAVFCVYAHSYTTGSVLLRFLIFMPT